jgi:hypothetical protein
MRPRWLTFILISMQSVPDSTGNIPDPAPKPSALRVAILRAAHQILDVPVVFEDALALRILGVAEQDSLRSNPWRYNIPRLKGLRASVVVRSRMAEEEWVRSKECGVRQYVILGAGLDTFGYRTRIAIEAESLKSTFRQCSGGNEIACVLRASRSRRQ